MFRSSSSLLFGLVLCLSFALLAWWTTFLLLTSGDIADAGERLAAGDTRGAAYALGADDEGQLASLARRRQWMFASEGLFFAVVLVVFGVLYTSSTRRERALLQNRERFLAAATHELKTPLATISLLLESLRDGRVPEAKRERYLSNGLLEAERLERGLHNVLTAGGLRTTGRAMHREPGDLRNDVQQAVEAMRARAQAADVVVRYEAPEAPLPARRDAAAWQLVLRNLLDNAIKFSPAGSEVRVTLGQRQHDAVLQVADDGRGMDARELQRAFEPFFSGDDQASGGTGLGLHLVHELVSGHGGEVRAESEGRGRGTTVTVRLPMEVRS